jgi:polyphosphate:AMP phosphotransferase
VLETVDLTCRLGKAEYEAVFMGLERRLGECQRTAREFGAPLVVVFEGWEAAGKGTCISRLALAFDARGFKVHAIGSPNEEERLHPWMWRFWSRLPSRDRIAIFDESWYRRVLVERVEQAAAEREILEAYDDILQFERQLSDDGYTIVKCFLHISKAEQKKRLRRLEKDPALAWKVTKREWQRHEQYDEYRQAVEEMFRRTSTAEAPWTIIESHDRRFARVKAAESILAAWDRAIAAARKPGRAKPARPARKAAAARTAWTNPLDRVDLSLTVTPEDYRRELNQWQKVLFELEHQIYVARIPVAIVYEGWDAAGKGGNIRRLVQGLDPRGYDVVPFGAPTAEEKAHHYLWRFWRQVPKGGHIAIFDRSWYGRVMVERIEGFCTQEEWQRAYQEINEFEHQLASFGTVIVKFWLHLSPEEQLRRFEQRQAVSDKRWKLTDEDWRNREKWDVYAQAVGEMIQRTSTPQAPWTIVEAESKPHARLRSIRAVAEAMQAALQRSEPGKRRPDK